MGNPSKVPSLQERIEAMRQAYGALDTVAPSLGLSPSEIRAAKIYVWQESSGDLAAKSSKSSAQGAFQFIESTWNRLRAKHSGLRDIEHGSEAFYTPEIQALGLSVYVADIKREMTQRMKGTRDFSSSPLTASDLYMTHKYGGETTARILAASPETPISALLSPKAIDNHKTITLNGKRFADFTATDLRMWVDQTMVKRSIDYARTIGTNPIEEILETDRNIRPDAASRIPPAAPREAIAAVPALPTERSAPKGVAPVMPENFVLHSREDPRFQLGVNALQHRHASTMLGCLLKDKGAEIISAVKEQGRTIMHLAVNDYKEDTCGLRDNEAIWDLRGGRPPGDPKAR